MPQPIKLADLVHGNPGLWLETYGYVRNIEGRKERVKMNVLQRRILAIYRAGLLTKRPVRVIGLKPRKKGFSTMVSALHYSQLQGFPHEGVIIGNKLATSEEIFGMTRLFAETDEWKQWGSPFKATSETVVWEHGAKLSQETAKAKDTCRGKTPQFLHGCVPPGTQVIIEDGCVLPIEDVKIGTTVLTHTGAKALVTDKIGQKNWKGPMIRITPWLGQAICFTKGHKIPTARGIIEAQDVREDDELCMPVRAITTGRQSVTLPETPARAQHGGLQGRGSGSKVRLDEEFGFVCGYYLAEGSVHGRKGLMTKLVFSRHRNEKAFTDRVAKRIKGLFTKRSVKDRVNSLTTQEVFSSTALAKWFAEEFGRVDGKRIPDWAFNAGEDFCRGLLAGLLSGDGSKGRDQSGGYACQKMVLPTTRASLAMQARDIAASLGYGWASCRMTPGGVRHGRNCKTIWRVVWNGDAARSLHQLVTGDEIAGGRKWVEKYRMEGGCVWIRVKQIERGVDVPFMWDLSVDHSDHTFRTPHFSIGNTEVAHWEDGEPSLISALNAMPDEGFTAVFLESTPYGNEGPFPDTWQQARWPKASECPDGIQYWKQWESMCPDQVDDQSGVNDRNFVRVFAAWFEFENSRIALSESQKSQIRDTIDSESWYAGERQLIDLYGNEGPRGTRLGQEVTDCDVWEQLAWRRMIIKTKCRGQVRKYDEEYPRDPVSCFLSSGQQVFDAEAITALQVLVKKYPADFGQIAEQTERSASVWRTCPAESSMFMRWEKPMVGCKYLVSVDLAEGEDQTKGANPDRHSALVWRRHYFDSNRVWHPTRLAARVKPPCRMPMMPFARAVQSLAAYYGNCMVIPEMNNSGMSFILALRTLYNHAPIWQRRERDPHSGRDRAWDGWRTTDNAEYGGLRATIIWHMHELLRNGHVEIADAHLISELAAFVDKNGRMEAGGGAKDDDVMSAAIGLFNIDSATEYSEGMRADMLPPDLRAAETRMQRAIGGKSMRW